MNPIFVKGFSPEGIVHSDLGKVSEGDKASNLYVAFWEQWLLEAKKPAASRSSNASICSCVFGTTVMHARYSMGEKRTSSNPRKR